MEVLHSLTLDLQIGSTSVEINVETSKLSMSWLFHYLLYTQRTCIIADILAPSCLVLLFSQEEEGGQWEEILGDNFYQGGNEENMDTFTGE